MRKIISTALALAIAATSAVSFTGTSEARRGHGYYSYDRGYHHGYRRHRHHGGNAAAAAVAGLALGAIIVGSTQQRYYDRGYRNRYYDRGYDRRYYDRGLSHEERCMRAYRSYDPRTDTFIGRNGREYYCNL